MHVLKKQSLIRSQHETNPMAAGPHCHYKLDSIILLIT
jgi:hypothetical protein